MNKVFLGLGSNMGDRMENLRQARIHIEESIGRISGRSSVYQTEPWGFRSKSDFLNMVVCVNTELTPSGVLGRILMIESQLGRIRRAPGYTSRKLDVDILLYDNEIINEEALVVPHPKLHERKFALVPLAEIAPDFLHPILNETITSLLNTCKDECRVSKFI